jgi:hypothetical protein
MISFRGREAGKGYPLSTPVTVTGWIGGNLLPVKYTSVKNIFV